MYVPDVNLCSKPRCARPGSVALAYDYAGRRAVLHDPPEGEMSPHLYALCVVCAEKMSPPRGWTIEDERLEPPLFSSGRGRAGAVTVEERSAAPAATATQTFFGASN